MPRAGWQFGGFGGGTVNSPNIKYLTVSSDTLINVKFKHQNHINIEIESNNFYIDSNGTVISGIEVKGDINQSDPEDWYYMDIDTSGIITASLFSHNEVDLDWYVYHESNLDSLVQERLKR